ncbi:glycosyltransferase [Allostreptomyces psammosilenae]|uniref:GT2 family glycosyltransferase n=1 Tax=Allostreptomyces psammosilenae TaxID=1892865 RepID=A0A852ZTJ7_9ACTN|nr:glycosyltransferase [Allostreptomyces psammosilenae]NYI04104.1 GT2 family glycosyltransferase [Allostreptomyces psammosilenae]
MNRRIVGRRGGTGAEGQGTAQRPAEPRDPRDAVAGGHGEHPELEMRGERFRGPASLEHHGREYDERVVEHLRQQDAEHDPRVGVSAPLLDDGHRIRDLIQDLRRQGRVGPPQLHEVAEAIRRHCAAKEEAVHPALLRRDPALDDVVTHDRDDGAAVVRDLEWAAGGHLAAESHILTAQGALAAADMYLTHERRDLVPHVNRTLSGAESARLAKRFQKVIGLEPPATGDRAEAEAARGSRPAAESLRELLTVVVVTHNRRERLMRTLDRLVALPGSPPVIVVDNASTDGTAEAVRARHPGVQVLRNRRNEGAAGRNRGVLAARTPFVAFSDDDSWWEPGALQEAVRVLREHPRLGLLAARTLVGDARLPDPVNAAMAASPLPRPPDAPGPAVLGFLACAAVVRRQAYAQARGFSPLLFIGGEEELLAMDLAAAGWQLAYVDSVVARHLPEPGDVRPGRVAMQHRNAVLAAWMRRPVGAAARRTAVELRRARAEREALRCVAGTLRRMPAALARRRRLPPRVERSLRALEETGPMT